MAHLGPAGEPVGVDREVVVLAGDLHLAGGQVAHGVVAAVVAEGELHGVGAERPAEELVAEADAEHRHVAEQPADGVDGVGHRGRVAGAVGEEHAGRLAGEHVGGGGRRRHHLHVEPGGEVAQDRALDAEVVGDHERALPVGQAVGGSGVVTWATRSTPSVPGSACAAAQQRGLVGDVERPEGAGDGADVADAAGELAGVDAGDARDAVGAQLGVEVGLAAPARPPAGQVAHHHAAAERSARLEVGQVHAVVPDVGVGEGDDLPGVGRVGDHLLVAGQHRVEHHLAGGHGVRPDRLPLEGRPVGQHQQRLPHRHAASDVCDRRRCDVHRRGMFMRHV